MDLSKLKQFLTFDPENDVLAIAVIEGLAANEEFDEAIVFADKSLTFFPNDTRFLSLKGELYIALSDYRSALTIYDKLVNELNIDEAVFKINTAFCLYQVGEFASALTEFAKLGTLSVSHNILKARCLHHLEEVDAAIVLIEGVVRVVDDENKAEVLGLLALLYIDNAEYSKVSELCDQALDLNPYQFDARLAKACLLVYEMKMDQALPRLLELNNEVTNSGRIMAMVGLCLMFRRDINGAISWYEDACRLMPNHVGSQVNLGWCYLIGNDLERAEVSFNSALEIERNFADVHGSLAVVAVLKSHWKEASILAKKALKLDENCSPALFAQAKYLEFKGEQGNGEELMDKMMACTSDVSGLNVKEMIAIYMSK